MQQPDDQQIRDLLASVKTVAVVGASDKQHRASYGVMKFMQDRGIRCIPVSPRLAGREVLGETAYATLADVPVAVDMVDVFRNSEAAGESVDEAIAIGAPAIWLQLGVINEAAGQRAVAAGCTFIQDRCPAIEWPRLGLS